MTFTLTHPGVPTFHPVSRLRTALHAHRAHAREVNARCVAIDAQLVSVLDRLDRRAS